MPRTLRSVDPCPEPLVPSPDLGSLLRPLALCMLCALSLTGYPSLFCSSPEQAAPCQRCATGLFTYKYATPNCSHNSSD